MNKARKRRLLAHGDCSNISSCRTNNSRDISRCNYNFLRYFKIVVCSTISRGTPHDVLWNPKVTRNPVWETYWLTRILCLMPCHVSRGWSPVCDRGGWGSIPGHSVRFVGDKLALRQFFLRVLLFSPVSIIPPEPKHFYDQT